MTSFSSRSPSQASRMRSHEPLPVPTFTNPVSGCSCAWALARARVGRVREVVLKKNGVYGHHCVFRTRRRLCIVFPWPSLQVLPPPSHLPHVPGRLQDDLGIARGYGKRGVSFKGSFACTGRASGGLGVCLWAQARGGASHEPGKLYGTPLDPHISDVD